MSAASRRKGLTGEREVAQAFAAHGFEVRGLEGQGDMLVVRSAPGGPKVWQVESKRYRERARWSEWIEQAQSEAPAGVPWMLVARGDQRKALAVAPFDSLLDAWLWEVA